MSNGNDWGSKTADIAVRIRERHPLIHHMTNYVVMNDTANATLAIGASPVMAHAIEEVAELAQIAGALVLNPGTLSTDWIESMLVAGKQANAYGVPIVYDPVGVGATRLRNETGARFLKELDLAVIRGNAGEIGSLSGAGGAVRGVDSAADLEDAQAVVAAFARRQKSVVAVTGELDILSDGRRVVGVSNGHPMLQNITGSGCMVTAVIGAFCAVEEDSLVATAAALAYYGLAAEMAGAKTHGPGSFRTALIDALYQLTPDQIAHGVRMVNLA